MTRSKDIYTPRVIVHGGAGNITREILPPSLWHEHQAALLSILESTNSLLKDHRCDALTAAVHAVESFESNPLYNASVGAVFTRTGTIELEASVMVSNGYRKRGAAVSLIKHVEHPIQLAAAILRKGEEEDAGGAQGHVHISGTSAEELASDWGLTICEESHFWTRKRWQEHRRGLQRVARNDRELEGQEQELYKPDGTPWLQSDPSWNGHDYLPQGTVGCVVMDCFGTVAVATSTGGITNKLPGRIGDTPTFGAGFWAEEFLKHGRAVRPQPVAPLEVALSMVADSDIGKIFLDCLPSQTRDTESWETNRERPKPIDHVAVGMSGTGNGDSFLRVAAVRTAAALVSYSQGHAVTLQKAVTSVAGPGGLLQRSAGEHWGKTGEGAGGIIGIERVNGTTDVVFDFNCGGLFRAWIDAQGASHCMVFRGQY